MLIFGVGFSSIGWSSWFRWFSYHEIPLHVSEIMALRLRNQVSHMFRMLDHKSPNLGWKKLVCRLESKAELSETVVGGSSSNSFWFCYYDSAAFCLLSVVNNSGLQNRNSVLFLQKFKKINRVSASQYWVEKLNSTFTLIACKVHIDENDDG